MISRIEPSTIGDHSPTGPEERTLLFRAGERVYGCEISVVKEIIPWRRPTRIPGSPEWVQGIINLRGTILTVFDLGQRITPSRPQARDGSIVMMEVGTRCVGIAVDAVMDVRQLVPERADAQGEGGLVRGVGHLDRTVVILIDVRALVSDVLL
ncbi:MAG: CheW protein [Gemmatimonadetes bacterium]|nr:CheW protein [Gemmatimonadota bacterium]